MPRMGGWFGGLVMALVAGAAPASAGAPACSADAGLKAADFSMPVTELRTGAGRPALPALKRMGVRTVIRYYEYPRETLACKTLTAEESDAILAEGLSIAVVFQHNNHDPETFFDASRGRADARRALALAEANGQPFGSAIYFSVDGVDQVMRDLVYEYGVSGGKPMSAARRRSLIADGKGRHVRHYARFLKYRRDVLDVPVDRIGPRSILPFVKRYFADVAEVFRSEAGEHGGRSYAIGAYGSGYVCDALLKAKLVKYCWLAQSTGWPGYDGFRRSARWSLRQENPTTCQDWTYPRDPSRTVQFDFNQVGATGDFGQWSTKRAQTVAMTRPETCPAP